jgi:hypothetical protein
MDKCFAVKRLKILFIIELVNSIFSCTFARNFFHNEKYSRDIGAETTKNNMQAGGLDLRNILNRSFLISKRNSSNE